ncbi:MAG TPA: METTL5 family protein [Candidatus Sulfotelmatobacter sp.]|jgi:putative methylase|nr:METTL5 family protein [Candidatus Sulfotelmatobacter sp.]
MEEFDQKRIVRKLDLERFISTIKPNPSPKASLEQYTISEQVAADILYFAAYTNGDIIGKTVLDLGCGTGRLALGASFLGAKTVVGIDVDETAIAVASEITKIQKLNADWIIGDISAVAGEFDTVLQNPPFGVQKRRADREFLEKALEIGCSIYSLHNHPLTDEHLIHRLRKTNNRFLQVEASSFMKRFVGANGGVIVAVYALLMTIPRMFDFHTKLRHNIVVDLYVIRKNFQS